jgi:hypothetical protein
MLLLQQHTRGNQESVLRYPEECTWTTKHCSDDKVLEAGGSVTGTLHYLALLQEIRVKNQPTKE